MREVSMFEAKTHFSQIISEVAGSHEPVIITKRGEQVAKIVPMESAYSRNIEAVIGDIQAFRAGVSGAAGLSLEEIEQYRREGQK